MTDLKNLIPSWLRWPPNCCETCRGPWHRSKENEHAGTCGNVGSLEYGVQTDSRFRCPAFVRKDGI